MTNAIQGSVYINGGVVDGSVQVTGTVGGSTVGTAIDIGGKITCGSSGTCV